MVVTQCRGSEAGLLLCFPGLASILDSPCMSDLQVGTFSAFWSLLPMIVKLWTFLGRVFCPIPRGRSVFCFFPKCRGFFLLLFSQQGWVCAVGVFAFPAVAVSPLLQACTTDVGFPISCFPPKMSSNVYSEALRKESESQSDFTLCLRLPGLLYFYDSPCLVFSNLLKFYLISPSMFICSLILPSMLYHS